jgi:hypothetical protein
MNALARLAQDVLRSGLDLWRRHLRHLWRMVHLVPPLFAAATLWLFALNGQLREIYLGIVEEQRWLKLLFGLASIGIISSALFTAYIRLAGSRVLALYGPLSNVYLDPWLLRARDILALVWGALPFAGVLLGFWQVSSSLPEAMNYLVASLLFASAVLALLWIHRAGRALGLLAMGVAALILAAIAAVPFLSPPRLLLLAHTAGPLAMVGLQLLAIFAVVAGLAALQRWLLPAVLVFVLALVFGANWASAPPADNAPATGTGKTGSEPRVVREFRKWLAERAQDIQAFGGRFPVFIIAAQGGGIYAASATATFLAKLQEDCPSFGRHVFAVSGVSGGAIGAAIYHAYANERQERPPSKCGAIPTRDPPHELATDIGVAITRDHLTPVLGPMVPELAAGLVADSARLILPPAWMRAMSHAFGAFLPAAIGRARALETSLACAHIAPDEAWSKDDGCFDTGSRLRLRQSLAASWRDGRGAHALILTTTRAESGSTVAFAPFGLGDMGEPSLEAFADEPYARPADTSPLVEAAVASARFPGVLPPYSLERGARQWNFVDGGYADDSGVTVAGAIYRALRDADVDARVDIRLILLTTDSGDDAARAAVGTTTLVEFRAPLEAVFNVRAGIGTREVVRAVNQLSDRASIGIDARVFLVEFRTPFLGWMISRTTNAEIARIVASREPCPEDAVRRPQPSPRSRRAPKSTQDLIRNNGCQLSYLRRLLRGGE